jgi:DNA-binding transcriptional MocR family regulator
MMPDLSWRPDVSGRGGARYRAIADALGDDVQAGRLAPGTRLPTHRALAEALGVTVGTITRAYTEAERRGLVDATVGRGTFVRGASAEIGANADEQSEAICFPALSPASRPEAAGVNVAFGTSQPRLDPSAGPDIDLSANYPVGTYHADALMPAMAAIRDSDRLNRVAGYQAAVGHPDHRAAGAAWVNRFGLDADGHDIVVTNGCQGGLSVTLGGLTSPGETILVETLAWPGIHAVAQQRGLRVVSLPMDDEGIEPDALREAARRHQTRAAVCMPTLQNPTNRSMSEARRRAVLDAAADAGVTMVEDDIYGFLPDAPARPLAALAPDNAVYATSLSKSVAPGLRVGYVKAPRHLVPRIAAAQRAASVMAGPLAAEIAMHAIQDGHAARAAEQQRREAVARQQLAQQCLPEATLLTHPASFHAWIVLPEGCSSAAFVRAAWANGIGVTPGDAFTADGRDPRGVRICLCAVADTEQLETALRRLADLLAEQPMAAMPPV